jgi:hypothetical protein
VTNQEFQAFDRSATNGFRLVSTRDDAILSTLASAAAVSPTGHFVAPAVVIGETLDWLDTYQGPVR